MQMVISCQRPFDMWNLSGRVYQNVLKSPDLKDKIKIGSYKEGQAMLGNQMAVLKGAKNPNAAKLFVEFLLSKEGADLYVEGEAVYSFREGYKAAGVLRPYLMDLSQHKLVGMEDWVGAAERLQGRSVRFGRKTSGRSLRNLQSAGAPTFRRPVNLRVLIAMRARVTASYRQIFNRSMADCPKRRAAHVEPQPTNS